MREREDSTKAAAWPTGQSRHPRFHDCAQSFDETGRIGMLAPIVICILLRDLYALPHLLEQLLRALVGLAGNPAHEPQQTSAIGKLL